MENGNNLPFKIGDFAESRSFETGYRGAWFRCKIADFTKRKGQAGVLVEYYDFTDEELTWEKLYQVPPRTGKTKEKNKELMIRPRYPPICRENEMLHGSEISELTVIVDGVWRVGDLVDWLSNDCYWSGRIIQLLGDGKAKIELKPPPLGEGEIYEVLVKDVRPSLDWSLEHGWKLPTQEGDPDRACARLVEPMDQVIGGLPKMDSNKSGQETEAGQGTVGSSVKLSSTSVVSVALSDGLESTGENDMQKQSSGSAVSKRMIDTQETIAGAGSDDSSARKRRSADSDSGQTLDEPATEVAEEEQHLGAPEKAGRILNSICSDSVEATVLDLEDCIAKVKELETILLRALCCSDAPRSQWQFVDNHSAPSRSK